MEGTIDRPRAPNTPHDWLTGVLQSCVRSSMDKRDQLKQLFELAYSNTSLLKSLLEGEIGFAEDETQNLRDFIQANLRRAVFAAPEKELEIQNSIESLVVGRGMNKGTDYDRETGRVKAS